MQGNQVLAGLQRKWKKNGNNWKEERFISGFGGTKNSGETSLKTAIRETLEELYEFIDIPDPDFNIDLYNPKSVYGIKKRTVISEELLFKIQINVKFVGPFINNGYHLYQLNFDDLNKIISMINQYLIVKRPPLGPWIVSIAYRGNLPRNVNDLITFPRQDLHQNIEILQIYNLFINGDELQQKVLNNKVRNTIFKINQNFSNNVERVKNNNSRR